MWKFPAWILLFGLLSCRPDPATTVEGRIMAFDPQNSEAFIEQLPVHYKYAGERLHAVEPDAQGRFSARIPLEERQRVMFHLDGTAYPLVLNPGETLTLRIDAGRFPLRVEAEGSDTEWNRLWQAWLEAVSDTEQAIQEELENFRNGDTARLLQLHDERVRLARRHFAGTPHDWATHRNVGEYLVRALQAVSHRKGQPDFDAAAAREEIFDYAREHGFFTLESQRAQRAGIRDFAHYYAMSFDVQDSLRSVHGSQLSEQDIRRLGYERLNDYRERVIGEFGDEAARAHAEMHLVAERLGEQPLRISEPSLSDYLQRYPGYEEYTRFLTRFHEEITTVRPGQPAVAFTLPDLNNEPVSMSDFENRYVLLDFWASWCLPCLDEFPHMRRIYENTSRDQFEIVAISTDEDSLAWRRVLERFDNPWVQLYGGDGFRQETFVSYRGGGIPFYILINPDGEIERYNDVRASFNLEAVLDSLLVNHPPR